MSKPTIANLSSIPVEKTKIWLSAGIDLSTIELVSVGPHAQEKDMCIAVENATLILGDPLGYNYISRRVMESAKNLKHILFVSVGYEGVDLEAAKELGVTVSNNPGDGVYTAEQTMMLILAVLKNVVEFHRIASHEYEEDNLNREKVSEFSGKTLGIMGLGSVGSQVAIRAKAFGAKILYHKRHRLEIEKEKELGVEYRTFDQLLEQSDILTVHLPLNRKTREIIGANEIAKMKDGSYIVNTARGGLIDEAALAEAIKSGKLYGVGVDYEPIDRDNPLIGLENVIMTPHSAASGLSKTGWDYLIKSLNDNLKRSLTGKEPLYQISDI